jgi:hypothetical protein
MDNGENCIMMKFITRIILRILLGSLNQTMKWAGHVARMGEGRGIYRVLVGRPEGKKPLGRPRRRWENNIKVDLREIGIDGTNWVQLAQGRIRWWTFVNTVINLRVP